MQNYSGTYAKLKDLDICEEKIKLKYQNDKVKIYYNYFNDYWDELCIDTWFLKLKHLQRKMNSWGHGEFSYNDPDQVLAIFDDDCKFMVEMKKLLEVVKKKIGSINGLLPATHKQCVMKLQETPKIKVVNGKRIQGKQIFLGSKTKNYENTELKSSKDIFTKYFADITSCRMFIKPNVFIMPTYTGSSDKSTCMLFKPFYTEYKYTKSSFKSPLNEGGKLVETELIDDSVDLTYNITV